MKKLVIAFAVLFLLAGGTASILKYLAVGPFAKSATPGVGDNAKVEKAKVSEHKRPLYITMDPIQVPVFQNDTVAGTILINYKIEVLNTTDQSKVAAAKRQLGDALIKDFSYYIPRTLRNNKTLDVTLIKYRIILVAERVLGKGVVNDALIQAMTSTNR